MFGLELMQVCRGVEVVVDFRENDFEDLDEEDEEETVETKFIEHG